MTEAPLFGVALLVCGRPACLGRGSGGAWRLTDNAARGTVLHQPGGYGVRVDSYCYAGYVIPPNYDSMIGKLIAIAQTREEAINTMSRALSEYVIEGVKTTIPFHLQLMQNEKFKEGDFNTKFLESFILQ